MVFCKFELRFEPELRIAFRRGDVNMHARFLAGKEEEPVWTFAKNRRAHGTDATSVNRFNRETLRWADAASVYRSELSGFGAPRSRCKTN